jgi:hypothetical protein
MAKQPDQFMTETIEFWQKRTTRTLTLDDAREIAENIGVFFEILLPLVGENSQHSPSREVS